MISFAQTTSPVPAHPVPGLYRSLEHWRGLAALWVMLFHAVGTTPPAHPLVELLKIPARPGWLGVHLFFVISGYCIAANVESLRRSHSGAVAFVRDRLCRILPTYWAAFGVTILLSLTASRFNHQSAAENLPVGLRDWLANVLLLQPYLGTGYYVIVYWTLPVELGFYLIVGPLFAAAHRSVRLAAGLALALAFGAVWLPPLEPLGAVTCWPEFVCGLLVFHALQAARRQDHDWRRRYLGLIVLLGGVGAVATHHVFPRMHTDQQTPFAALFALTLYALHSFDAAICRAWALRWLGFCGQWSFSLYLLHYPVGLKTANIAQRVFPMGTPWEAGAVVISCVSSAAVSYAFYRVCEARFERWRHSFKARPLIS